MNCVTKNMLTDVLRGAGVKPCDWIHVHSSLSSFGYFEGGAEAVIDALLDTVSDGTLSIPSLAQKEKERRFETWDINNTPSDVGRITEVFRTQPGTLRSDHPTHAVCARGKLAEFITQGHRTGKERPGTWGGYAFGHNSPWQKMYGHNAVIVLLGTDFNTSTIVHYIEYLIVEQILEKVPPDKFNLMAEKVSGWNKPGVWPSYNRLILQTQMDEKGLLRHAVCGNCNIIIYNTRDMIDEALTSMNENPEKWFNEAFLNWRNECMKSS